MAYDAARGVTILFGGSVNDGDTREWDGVRWAQVAAEDDGGPSARYYHAMAYDSERGVTVLFGGAGPAGPSGLGDTWEWDGVRWALVSEQP